ncbi:hypothetical protein [Streptomyces sp. CMB-StM0423]|uniref:hypothetical protein n=1 Tax=Streptomyces sp. CMB-StM0423 TaxID=2059884 RepID=UPI000C70242B|nr:hypothetical protein [Streptomyces sp. CMB-StM0423]AUH43051.1 hypothetical protein CXR04_25310 [Streptomyces sp. CMB-StM0423]
MNTDGDRSRTAGNGPPRHPATDVPATTLAAHRTSMAAPVYLPQAFPPPDATPAPGCARCAELATSRRAARAKGDLSAVSDANVLIRRHPH